MHGVLVARFCFTFSDDALSATCTHTFSHKAHFRLTWPETKDDSRRLNQHWRHIPVSRARAAKLQFRLQTTKSCTCTESDTILSHRTECFVPTKYKCQSKSQFISAGKCYPRQRLEWHSSIQAKFNYSTSRY